MSSEMNQINALTKIIAKNLVQLRKANNMTQAGLAEQLGYSDKSVSKWERAEGMPDVVCLKNIADLFGVTVDYFFYEEHAETAATAQPQNTFREMETKERYVTNHRAVALLSIAGVWMLAALVYVIVVLCGKNFLLPFVIALPVTSLLLIIFHAMWGNHEKKRFGMFMSVSLLIWTILLLVCYICREHNLWLLMVLGFPATVVVALACLVKKRAEEQNNIQEDE